jgi:hypothetical protein
MTWKRSGEERGVTTHPAGDQCKSEVPEAMPPLGYVSSLGTLLTLLSRA